MELKMKPHIENHVEVLSQYMNSKTTEHTTLAGMIVRMLIKLFKKPYFEYALDVWFARENLKPVTKLDDKIKTLRSLLLRKFDTELVDMIIADVLKYYKVKLTK